MVQALLVWAWASIQNIWCPAIWFFQEPVMVGLVLGTIYGKPVEGVIVGAAINMTFLGWISAGGANASDKQFAGLIGVLMALQTNMDTATAVALSVPIAALGNYVHVAWMTIDSFCPTFGSSFTWTRRSTTSSAGFMQGTGTRMSMPWIPWVKAEVRFSRRFATVPVNKRWSSK